MMTTKDEMTRPKLPQIAYAQGQTDSANAERFIDEYHRELLHVPPWKKWLSWDGTRWANDGDVGARQRAKRYAKSLWKYTGKLGHLLDKDELGKLISFIRATNQTPKMAAFLSLAEVDERVVCPVDELNADPTLLNCVNGTVDLVTGKLRPHSPADRITQICSVAYDANAVCPEWIKTLGLIFDDDQSLVSDVERLLGYSLSGDTGEQLLPIAFGNGFNGKSTIWNVVAELLGDYASLASEELLLGDKSNHPTEKAALYQMRFVAISEPQKGSRLKTSRMKELTGDRLITARRMHEDFWSFQRTHTFWLSTNHLSKIDDTDEGCWRRVKLIPFSVDVRTKVKPIPDFDKWLVQHEGPGILAWMVRGYLDYKEYGLQEPESVQRATAGYRSDSDALGEFLAEFCIEERGAEVLATELFRVYTEIHKGKWSQTAFGKAVAERFKKSRSNSGQNRKKTVYEGLRFRELDETDSETENHQKHDENTECPQLPTVREVLPSSTVPNRSIFRKSF